MSFTAFMETNSNDYFVPYSVSIVEPKKTFSIFKDIRQHEEEIKPMKDLPQLKYTKPSREPPLQTSIML